MKLQTPDSRNGTFHFLLVINLHITHHPRPNSYFDFELNYSLFSMRTIFIFACLGVALAGAQTLQVIPDHALLDQQETIRAEGLQPNERVEIQARLTDGAGHTWSSSAEFVADAHGDVDTSKQPPVKGSYAGISGIGLIWSMKPTDKHVNSYEFPRDLQPQLTEFTLMRNGKPLSVAHLEQLAVTADVRQIEVQGTLHGVLFLPASAGPHAGILVVGGSEGGVPLEKAAWLASHGFAVLALAYFHYEGLPPDLAAIPLEYFGQALAWMASRSEIAADRIAVVGTSRGGELALQLASMYPQIKAVIAYVPANVRFPSCCGNLAVPYAWTWHGQPLIFVPRRLFSDPEAQAKAEIAVEQIRSPVLLIAGEDDGVWPSARMATDIANRLRHARFTYQLELLKYPHAGHRAGRPEICPMWHGKLRHPISHREVDIGGSVSGDVESSLDAIPKVLSFLDRALNNGTSETSPTTALAPR
jgi:dienelactone hydrolase